MSVSCIYEGTIRHRRLAAGVARHRADSTPAPAALGSAPPPTREFRHRLALAYIDLAELPDLLGGRLLARSPGLLRFRRRDYLGDPRTPLDQAVRDRVEAATGLRAAGPIRLLTQLRSFGHCFNPVSFYYCFDESDERLTAVLAEVTNTPWGERHSYVLPARPGLASAEFEKAIHVSPFMGMDHRYVARAAKPGETLSVHIESRRLGSPVFDATLSLRRRPLTRRSAAALSARYPLAAVRTLGLIYLHALGLKLAGFPVHPHPRPARA